MTLSALTRLPIWSALMPDLRTDTTARRAGLSLEVNQNQACDENAFHYFLANERQRALAADRRVVLMLVECHGMSPVSARKVLSRLSRCLRDTDIVGWFRQGRIAGAILTHGTAPVGAESLLQVRRRVEASLKDLSPRVRVRKLTASGKTAQPLPENDGGLPRVSAGFRSSPALILSGDRS